MARADSLVVKILSSFGIELLKFQTSIADDAEIGVLLTEFANKLNRKNADGPETSFVSLDAAGILPTLVLNENVTPKGTGSWSNSNFETRNLPRMYIQSEAAYGLFAT